MRTMRELLAALGFVAAACFSTAALATIPVIHHALLDATTSTLTLDGENFGTTAGRAWLAKVPLTVQSWDDKKIVAALPTGLAPGSHLVTIQTARLLPAFFVADLAGGTGTGDPGRIAGTVSACGGPVARTLVYIPGRSYIVYTGSSGGFRLDRVPVGTYTLFVETPGQPVRVVTGVTVNSGETTDLGTISVIDLNSNSQHCGACGNQCPGGPNGTAACVAGTCQAQACNFGFADCDGNPATGCEVHVQSNPFHCGGCNIMCVPGAQCVAGLCIGGTPQPPSSCTTDIQCTPDQFCDMAQMRCQAKGIVGVICSGSNQCQAGLACVGGFCQAVSPCPAGSAICAPTNTCVPIGSPCPPIGTCPAGMTFCAQMGTCVPTGSPCPPA